MMANLDALKTPADEVAMLGISWLAAIVLHHTHKKYKKDVKLTQRKRRTNDE